MFDIEFEIKSFLDKEMKLVKIPRKRKKLLCTLFYLAKKFDIDKIYKENEINSVIKEWHTFNDYATLRRLLCDMGFLERDKFGRTYRLTSNSFKIQDFQSWIDGINR